MIRLPDHRAHALTRLQKAAAELRGRNGCEPTVEEAAAWLQMDPSVAKRVTSAGRDVVSLDAPVHSGTSAPTLSAAVADEQSASTESRVFSTMLRTDLRLALRSLSRREADILRRRFGLAGPGPMTLKEVAGQYGLSSERIRQLEQQALENMRDPQRRQRLEPYLSSA